MKTQKIQNADKIHFTDTKSMSIKSVGTGGVDVSVQSNPADNYGVAVARVAFNGTTFISGVTTHHMIGIGCSPPVKTDHMIEGKRLRHYSGPGSLCLCPAGARYFTRFSDSMAGIILRISPECLALTKAEFECSDAILVEQMDGRDAVLEGLATQLEAEAAADHPNGMLFWSSVTTKLLSHLVQHHMSKSNDHIRGGLKQQALRRVDDFINENLNEPLDLNMLATVAGCSRFQFARLFQYTVGITPYRYVVRRRLKSAVRLLEGGNVSLAEVSASTGFSDQSHMTRWMKRVYGTTPAQLFA